MFVDEQQIRNILLTSLQPLLENLRKCLQPRAKASTPFSVIK